MKIKTTVEKLNKALDGIKVILNDTLLADDQRNIIFWVDLEKNQGVKLVARNNIVDCICDIEADATPDESGVTMYNIRYKELLSVLDGFKSLKVTQATTIEFEILDTVIKVEVAEEPIDVDGEFADKLYRINRYQLSKPRGVVDIVRSEIEGVSLVDKSTPISRNDIMPYFNALLPTIKDMHEGFSSRLNVVGDFIFTTPSSYAAIMRRTLNVLPDFILTSSAANFMKAFFDLEEVTNCAVEETKGGVFVTLENSMAKALVKAQSSQKAFRLDNYLSIPSQGIGVDKGYFCDVIKRFNSAEAIQISISGDEMTLSQAKGQSSAMVTVTVPFYTSRFNEDFDGLNIKVNSGVLSTAVFSHVTFGSLLFIYFEKVGGKWSVTFTDDCMVEDKDGKNVHLWYTSGKF